MGQRHQSARLLSWELTGAFLCLAAVTKALGAAPSLDSILLKRAVPLAEYRASVDDTPEFMRVPTASQRERQWRSRRLEDGDDDAADDDAAGDDEGDGEDDDAAGDDYYNANAMEYDFSKYSLKYTKCQKVQRFSERAIESGEYSSLVMDDIVILRLCPAKRCSSSSRSGCSTGYGEYAMNLVEYLKVMLRYKLDMEKRLCYFCYTCKNGGRRLSERSRGDTNRRRLNDDDDANGDDDGGSNDDYYGYGDDYAATDDDDDDDQGDDGVDYCSTYYDTCQSKRNQCAAYDFGDGDDAADDAVADDDDDDDDAADDDAGQGDDDDAQNGDDAYDEGALSYGDYLQYMGCVKVRGEDNYGKGYYYINPSCDTSSGHFVMSIFYDPYCSLHAGDLSVNEFTGMTFQNDFFQEFYGGNCVSCASTEVPPYYDVNNYMCNRIYARSGKCDTYLSYDLTDDDQYADDYQSTSCSFIDSIHQGTYDEYGQLYTEESLHRSRPSVITFGQKLGLGISALVCVILALYSCMLHHEITNLLLKSLSRGQLIPPASASRRGRSRTRSNTKFSTKSNVDEDWDHDATKTNPIV